MLATEIRKGPLNKSDEPLTSKSEILKMKGCPDCNGRGWFLIRPFMTGGTNGAGGVGNTRQCLCCLDCKAYYDEHGTLPDEILKTVKLD